MIKNIFIIILMVFLMVACSDDKYGDKEKNIQRAKDFEEAIEADKQKKASQEPSEIYGYTLAITPEVVYLGTVLHLTSTGFKLIEGDPNINVTWYLNGNPTSSSRPFVLDTGQLDVRRGDMIMAKVTATGIEVTSQPIVVLNNPPKIIRAKIMPENFSAGQSIYLDVQTEDRDGDNVTLNYQWTVNGAPAGTSAQLDSAVKRNDNFSVLVTPFDGQDFGDPINVRRKVGNMPPMISYHTQYSFDGTVYTYQTQATDADGDTLIYGLKDAQAGMSISGTGLVTWNVPTDFVGTANYKITVADPAGGYGEMQMGFTLK